MNVLAPAPAALAVRFGHRPPTPVPQPGLTRRAGAFAIDLAILASLTWLVAIELLALGLVEVRPLYVAGNDLGEPLGLLWLLALVDLPVTLLYFTVAEGFAGGRSLGKLLLGLKVVKVENGRPPDVLDAFLRNLLRLLWIGPFAPVFLAADFWLMATGELEQRTGDLASGTMVVLDPREPRR
ncbi:MAG TPA: RDD family protein [Candidatus Thermoplasmatota archaeon]|nr:RDD family protein [Candidatus Thermoplasmatota archaeon]